MTLHAQKNIECWLKGIVHPKISIITLAKFCRHESSIVFWLLYELCFIHCYTIDNFKQSSFVLVNLANQLQISERKFLTTCKITIDGYRNHNLARKKSDEKWSMWPHQPRLRCSRLNYFLLQKTEFILKNDSGFFFYESQWGPKSFKL